MDDRKRKIDELEKNKRENRFALDALLENFGEQLYIRIGASQPDFEDVAEYNRLKKEIADANSAIALVEEQNRRFLELEDTIEIREREEKERAKEMAVFHRKLGKALLENDFYNDFTTSFREQADILATKVSSLDTRIGEIENKEGGNVFSWIGKSAQGLVLRSFLSKAQDSQDTLFRTIGERYSKGEKNPVDSATSETALISVEIERLNGLSRAVMEEVAVLRDEKRQLSAGFDIEGNPQKQIANLKSQINSVMEKLKSLYRNFGTQLAGIMDAEISPERKYFIDTIVTAEDSEIIGRAVRLNQLIINDDIAIDKLRASLAIDEEKAKIDKFQRYIEEKKSRIAECEQAIIGFEGNIKEAENRIHELQKGL
jgi:peptidoglycan hydrolase CwlO-like protein